MTPTNKLKPRLYRHSRMGNCSKPTVFPKYTFFSNESERQHAFTAGYDEDHAICNRDSKMQFTKVLPFVSARSNAVFDFSDRQN